MTTRMRVAIAAALSVSAGGCALSRGVRGNTAAIGGSTSAIASNTKAIQESTAGTTLLVPALQGVEKLRGPMGSQFRNIRDLLPRWYVAIMFSSPGRCQTTKR